MDRLEEIAQRLENLNPGRTGWVEAARPAHAEVVDEGADVAISLHPALSTRIDGPAGETLDSWSNTLVTSVMRILWEDPTAWSDAGMSDRAARARALRNRDRVDLREPIQLADHTPAVRRVGPPPVPESAGPARRVAERVA